MRQKRKLEITRAKKERESFLLISLSAARLRLCCEMFKSSETLRVRRVRVGCPSLSLFSGPEILV